MKNKQKTGSCLFNSFLSTRNLFFSFTVILLFSFLLLQEKFEKKRIIDDRKGEKNRVEGKVDQTFSGFIHHTNPFFLSLFLINFILIKRKKEISDVMKDEANENVRT